MVRIVAKLESNIEEQLEEGTLAQWKEQEEDFKMKVVDMAAHENLENPYEAKQETGKSSHYVDPYRD